MLSSPTTCLRAARLVVRISTPRTKSLSRAPPATTSLLQQSRTLSSIPQRPLCSTSNVSSQIPLSSILKSKLHTTATCLSTTAHPTSPSSTPTPNSSTTNSSSYPPLTWDRYLKLRLSRRRYGLFGSVVTSISTASAGAIVLASADLDTLGLSTFGLDPMVSMGLATLVCGAAGWLVGPFLGDVMWGLFNRGVRGEMKGKEREFYARIKKWRSDPAGVSVSNPLPDYYGEKIGSVSGYRRWLKDQRAFRKKREG